MAVLTVGQLRELLTSQYDDNELLVVAWWYKGDIESDVYELLESEGVEPSEEDVEQVWANVSAGFDDFVDELSSQANDELFYQVQRNL